MTRPLSVRALAAALGTTAVAATLVVVASSGSSATAAGPLTFAPSTGTDTTDVTVTTGGACPQAATNVIVTVTGGDPATPSSQVSGGIIVGNTPISAYNKTPGGGLIVPLTQNFHDFAQTSGFTPLKGTYTVTLTCRTQADPASLMDYAGGLVWTPGAAAFSGTYEVVPSTVATTTALEVTPPGPVQQGAAVTLHATVTPAQASGTVQFKDGTANVGSPVTVTAGAAELVTTALAPGSRSLKAVFTPADAGAYGPSTSSAVAYQVNAPAPAFLPTVYPAPRAGVASRCVASASDATSMTYAWLKNGVVIAGATAVSRVVPESEYGAQLSCRVTASNTTNPPLVGTSPALTVTAGPALRATTLPYLSPAPRVGTRVYCKPGAWTPAATSYTYRWRLGSAYTTTTASSVVPPSTWRGKYLSCVVTAKRTTWTNGVAASKSAKVA